MSDLYHCLDLNELVPGSPVGGGAGARVAGSSKRERGIGLHGDDIYSVS